MTANNEPKAGKVTSHDPVVLAELTGAVAAIGFGVYDYFTNNFLMLAGIIALGAFVVFYQRVLSARAARRNRVKTLRWRTRCKLKPGRGYASTAEVGVRLSSAAALKHGKRARPSLSLWRRVNSPVTDYAVRLGRSQYGLRTYSRLEDQVLLVAPPRTGKSGMLADRIVDHPGGVVATSTRPDLFMATREDRARMGRIEIFNPQQVGTVEAASTMRFDLLGPCADLVMARRMATWLSGGSGGAAHGNIEWFEQKGEVALAGLLYAGAITGATITDVFGWVQHAGHETALKALAEYGTPEMHAVTANALKTGNKTAGSVRETIDLVLSWAALPQLAEAVTPRPGEPMLDVYELARMNGTLYLIGSGDERSPLTPLFRALTSFIHYEAGIIGTRCPAGRLDPPLLLALDEVTQICPVDLPSMLADSAGKGILIEPVCHSVAQLEARYGSDDAANIWSLCGTKVMLPGISDPQTLRNVAQLLDQVETGGRDRDIVPAAFLRTLPDWHALVITMNRDPFVVRTRPVWQRADRRWPTKFAMRRYWQQRAPQRAEVLETVDVPAVTRVMEPEVTGSRDYAGLLPAQPPAGDGQRPSWPVNGERVRGR